MHTPVVTRPHNVDPSGTYKIYRFPNGFGASVVKFAHSYGGRSGLWELAVVKFKGDEIFDYNLTYSTPITDDVIGYLTLDAVEKLLDQIEALPAEKGEKA